MNQKKNKGKHGILIILLVVVLCACGILAGLLAVRNQSLEKDNGKLTSQVSSMKKQQDGQDAMIQELNQQIKELNETPEDTKNPTKDSQFRGKYPDLYAYEKGQEDKKTVYLTFDDGPSDLTPKVLDVLDRYNAKATFFVVYTEDAQYTKYLQEIVDRGHTLAIHSYTHKYNVIYQSQEAYLNDLSKVFDWVYDNTGVRPSLYRFPGGSTRAGYQLVNGVNPELTRRGFTYYDWNVSSGDGSNLTTAENEIENVCNNVKLYDTPVVLMHDGAGKTETLKALPTILEKLSKEGCDFKALNDDIEPVQYTLKKK